MAAPVVFHHEPLRHLSRFPVDPASAPWEQLPPPPPLPASGPACGGGGGAPSSAAYTCLAYCPRGLFLALGTTDGRVALWDVAARA